MHSSLTDYERQMISKLPSEIASLADRYPIQVMNVAHSWENRPLPENYIPHHISVYCGDSEESSVLFLNGKFVDFTPVQVKRENTSLSVRVDGDFVYIEIEGREVLNKLGGLVLPEISFSPEELIKNISLEEN